MLETWNINESCISIWWLWSDTDYAKNPKVDKESFANQGSHKDKTSIAQNTADKSALPTSM